MFYSRIPFRRSVYMESMLKNPTGTFIAPGGILFYKCLLTNVNYSDNLLHAKWVGRKYPMDINNYEAIFQLQVGCPLKEIDQTNIDTFLCKLNGETKMVHLPYTVRNGDMLLLTEQYFMTENRNQTIEIGPHTMI